MAYGKLASIVNSKGYLEAREKIRKWKDSLEREDPAGILRADEERSRYFSDMRAKDPELFEAFRVDAKALGERRSYLHERMRLIEILGHARDCMDRLRQSLLQGTGFPLAEISFMKGLRDAAFFESARGHEAPALILRDAQEAREHSKMKLEEAKMRVPQPANPAYSAPYQAVDGKIQADNEGISREITGSWLGPSFLDDQIVSARFSRTPPILTTESASFFQVHEAFYGYPVYGFFFPGTNHIVASSQFQKEADRRVLIAHEQLHYASWLGGGFSMFAMSPSGETVFGYVSWLHEGLTELHAEELTRDRGFRPGYVAYPYETTVAAYMRRLMSDETMKRAYLTGDFTQPMHALDQLLGEGSFRGLLAAERGADALGILVGKLDAAGIKHSKFLKDHVIKAAGVLK